ncbi:MAG: ComF family protein [Gammaproteobacteria bacterium]
MFQHYCVLCEGLAEGRDLCVACQADLPWLGASCVRCARPLATAPGAAWCGRCLRRPTLQAATRVAFRYAFPIDQLLQKLKFGGSLPPGRVLGELLAQALSRCEAGVEALVPVPLHPRRMRERGFNQAVEIARPIARALELPLLTRACRRVRDTPAQSGLDARARRRNPVGAFTASDTVHGKRIAIIDDVYTSGSTIAAVTHALLHAGATRVEAWCVARGGTGS